MSFSIGFHDEDDMISLDQAIQDSWSRRKSQLEHEFAVTGWALSILPEICLNVSSDLTGEHHLMMENVVERLHVPPCLNDQVLGQDMTAIIDSVWQEFKHWQNMTGCYAVCHGRFSTPDVLEERSHIWHETYSLPYTKVLGFLACRVTSKR